MSKIWTQFKPLKRGVNFVFGGESLEEVFLNFLKYNFSVSHNTAFILSEEFKNTVNYLMTSKNRSWKFCLYHFKSSLTEKDKCFNELNKGEIHIVKRKYNIPHLIKSIEHEKNNSERKLFYVALPKCDFFSDSKETIYQIERNLIIFKKLQQFAIRNNLYLTVLYKMDNRKILSLFPYETFKELMNMYNSFTIIRNSKKQNCTYEIINYSKGKRNYFSFSIS